MANAETSLSVTVLLGLILFVGYIIYLRATLRSIGIFGMILILAVVGTLLWVLFDQGFISLDNPTVNTWIGIVALSIVLAVGLSWSIVRRRLTGQTDVDDIDE
jgi:drug/metabolite transporter (DMT)-like permease